MRWLVYTLPAVIFAALLFASVQMVTNAETGFWQIKTQRELPEASLPLLYGEETWNPKEVVPGRYRLINLFASWCISCLAEHPHLLTLQENPQLQLIGIAWQDKPENTKRWLEKHGNPYDKVAVDQHGRFAIGMGITGIPESFLINPKGEVVEHVRGPITPQIMQEKIHAYIR